MAHITLADHVTPVTGEVQKSVEPQVSEVHSDGDGDEAASTSSTETLRETWSPVDSAAGAEPKQQPQTSSQHSRRITILPASGITTDFDQLRFEAAAARQFRLRESEAQDPLSASTVSKPELLISSPYNRPEHLLDLTTLDTQNRLLSLALAVLKPIRTDYAIADYLETFNWPEILRMLRQLSEYEKHEWKEQKFYTVVFRSKLNAEIDEERLGDLDRQSHREATESGGLLKYWFGAASEVGRENLATCEYIFHFAFRLVGKLLF